MDEISEAKLQRLVEEYCLNKGVLYYHTRDSRGSVAGFPDLVILASRGIVLVELKSETGKLSRAQKAWLDASLATTTPFRIWRPADWRSGAIQAAIDGFADHGNDVVRTIVRRCANALRDERARGTVRRSMQQRPPAKFGGVKC